MYSQECKNWLELLNNNIPLYYYSFEGDSWIDDLNYDLNLDYGLQLIEPIYMTNKEGLYKIKTINYDQ